MQNLGSPFAFFGLCLLLVAAPPPAAHAQQAQSSALPSAPILRIETKMHGAAIDGLSADADGRFVVTASLDKTVRVWDAASGALLSVLRPPIGDGYEGKMYAVALSPDGRTVACGGFTDPADQPKSLYFFDRATGRLVQRVGGLPGTTLSLTYSPDGQFLAAALSSGGVRLFRASRGVLCGQDAAYADSSYGVSFGVSGGGLRLVTSCLDGQVRLYDVATDGALSLRAKRQAPSGSRPFGVAFSPDGSRIAVGYADRMGMSVLSGSDLSLQYQPDIAGLDNGSLSTVCWSADGQTLYAGGTTQDRDSRRILRVWENGGRGGAADYPLVDDTIMYLQPRPRGGVFFAASTPAWGVLDGGGRQTVFVGPAIADFRDNPNGLLLSADGSAVQFGYQDFGKTPAVFSLGSRVLILGGNASGLRAPVTTAAGLDIRGEEDTAPTLNGKALALRSNEIAHSFAIAPDRRRFLIGASFFLYCFGADGTRKWNVPAPGATYAVNVSGDGRLGVAAFGDGTIRWYRMSDGRELLAFFPHKDGKRWALWTPSGYYDCSPGGEDLIGWHVNRGRDQAADFFPAGRFRSTFYRPDVVSQMLAALDEKAALQQANDAAGRNAQPVAAAATVQASLPPVVALLSPQSNAAVSAPGVTLQYSLRTPSDEPVTEVRALVDGRPVKTESGLSIVSTEGVTRRLQVNIPPKDCQVSLIAVNAHGASEPTTISLRWTGAAVKAGHAVEDPENAPEFAVKSTLYLLAVGISKYQDPALQLTYPDKDAHDFAQAMLKQKGRLYQDVIVKELTDADATKDNILDGLDWLQKQTTSNDVAMLFLSGHGSNDSSGKYFFLPADFNRDKVKRTGLPWTDIVSTVQEIAGKIIVFNDSCHAGNILGGATKGLPDTTGAVNELLSAENGAVVFSAATGSEYAREDAAWGNGAFTKALVEGIDGKADYDHSGRITINMLALYIPERVKALTDGTQHPTANKPPTVRDFPIALDGTLHAQ